MYIKSDALINILGINDGEVVQKLSEISEVTTFSKGEIIIHQDEYPKKIHLLLEGVFRGYFFDIDGKDITDCFGFKLGAAAISSLGIENFSPINVEALTDCKILSISSEGVLSLMKQFPQLVYIYNQLLLDGLKMQWEIKIAMYQFSAMHRYQWFLEKYPDLINQIPNKYVASFLGMSPVTLSRLRKELREKSS